jgi:hypothetical protein
MRSGLHFLDSRLEVHRLAGIELGGEGVVGRHGGRPAREGANDQKQTCEMRAHQSPPGG